MGRLAPKYTAEQNAYVEELALAGYGAQQIVQKCAAGTDKLEGFEIPHETARVKARAAIKRHRPETLEPIAPDEQQMADAIRDIVSRELTELRAKPDGKRDLARAKAAASILLDLEKLGKARPKKAPVHASPLEALKETTKPSPTPLGNKASEPSKDASQLANEANKANEQRTMRSEVASSAQASALHELAGVGHSVGSK